jgi:hypothetical protein
MMGRRRTVVYVDLVILEEIEKKKNSSRYISDGVATLRHSL